MNIVLGIFGYFVGMIVTLVCLKCAGSDLIENYDDSLDALPIIFWPLVVVFYAAFLVLGIVEVVANAIVSKVCPNKE